MCPRSACGARGRRTDPPLAALAPRRSLDPDLGELRRVVAEDVDDLDHDRVAARSRVLVPAALGRQSRVLTRPIGLPLVVEDVVSEVVVDRPVVDEVRPRVDALTDLRRDQLLARNRELLEYHARLVALT